MLSSRFALPVVVSVLCLLAPKLAPASDIGRGGHADMSCYVSLTGPIEAGDVEKLDRTLIEYLESTERRDHPSLPRVCLNSDSGDYEAALTLVEQLGGRFATAVGPGDTCAGPCALVFMAGRPGEGGTLDTQQGGRIVHPKGLLQFGEKGAPALTVDQVARLLALQDAYDLPADVIRAMIHDGPEATPLSTVAEAARWQIRVAPSLTPENLTPLGTWQACINGTSPLLPKLRFADWDYYNPDYPRTDTPVVRDGTIPEGTVTLRLSSNGWVSCGVSLYGASELSTGRVGTVRLTLGREDGLTLYRALYGPEFFSPETAISDLARADDGVPETVSVSARSAPSMTRDPGLCGRIEGGALVWHQACVRTRSEAPAEDMTALISTRFETEDGTRLTATATGEVGRYWPEEIQPVHKFEGRTADFHADGLPDEGDDGNEPGADAACRIVTDGRSEWCFTSFWHTPDTGETFIFIAERDYDSGLYYADQ